MLQTEMRDYVFENGVRIRTRVKFTRHGRPIDLDRESACWDVTVRSPMNLVYRTMAFEDPSDRIEDFMILASNAWYGAACEAAGDAHPVGGAPMSRLKSHVP